MTDMNKKTKGTTLWHKKYFLAAIATIVVVCTALSIYRQDEQIHADTVLIDTLLTHGKTDSAYQSLRKLRKWEIQSKSELAYYNLLQAEIMFRKNIAPPEYAGINQSIEFYGKAKDYSKLARAYYVKGRIADLNGNIKECVRCMTMAESAASNTNDNTLKCRIYITITSTCINGGERHLALENGRKAIYFGEKSGNKELLTYCYSNFAAIYARFGNQDSAIFYTEKYIPLIRYLPDSSKMFALTNIGAAYEFRDPAKAKKYARKALEIRPYANAYHLLGAIAYREGRTEAAKGLLKRGIKASTELMRTISMTEDLAEYEQKEGNSGEAARLLKMATTMRDSLARKNTADSIAGVMAAHELLQAEHNAEAERGNWMAIVAALASVAVAAALATVIYLKRTRQYLRQAKVRVEKSERQLNALKEKLAAIKATSKKEADAHKKALAKMEAEHDKAMKALNKAMEETMANGHQLYVTVERGESISQWKKKEMAWFTEYYMAINKEFAHAVETEYKGLTYRQMVFLVLEDMGKSAEEIMEAMGISPDNFRKMRSVINTKRV